MALVDFEGFTFNNVHSSEMNLVRVSDGSRYNESIGPAFSDKTMQIAGRDGTYYFNTQFTQKTFSISVAFDNMSEQQYRKFRQTFTGKAQGDLIFDELPFKAYNVKLQNQPTLKTICFEDEDGARVYKGEGTIQFISYYPYAKSVHNYLNAFDDDDYPNKEEWAAASGLPTTEPGTSGKAILVTNIGDAPLDWIAYYESAPGTITVAGVGAIQITESKKSGDTYIGVNSRTGMVEGYSAYGKRTGTIYKVASGNVFKIPVSSTAVTFNSTTSCAKLDYQFLYY